MRPVAILTLLVTAAIAAACPWGRRCCAPPPVYYYYPLYPPPVIAESPPPAPEPKPAVKVVQEDVAPPGWCHIRGRIVFDGDPVPEQKEIPKDGGAVTENWVVNPKNRGVKNVVVWLVPELTKEHLEALQSRKLREVPPFPPQEVYTGLSQRGQRFIVHPSGAQVYIPHVLAVQAGSNVTIRNDSQLPDNPKWTSRNNGEFSPLVPPGKDNEMKDIKAERFPINIESSIYPWMKAYVWVFDHPYFAVTDADGRFHIRYAPTGNLRLAVWQEETGFKGGREGRWGEPIRVPDGKLDLGEIKLQPTR
jgi:hypothetical protein